LPAAAVLMRLPRALGFLVVVVAVTVSWSMAMVRNQHGVHTNVIRAFVEGFQLPWLNTLGKMGAQYIPWLEGRPSPLPAFLLVAVVLAGIWGVRNPWKSPSEESVAR
ncbi:MAG: hypothetical protein ABIT38_16345, partial [Gemmatimonadaceae bacterium]